MADVLNPVPIKTKQNTDVKIIIADSAGTNLLAVDASGRITVLAVQSGTWNVGTLTSITNPVTVVGKDADGAASTDNPVQVAGKETGGTVQSVLVDANGKVYVLAEQSGTWNIGTVTAVTGITNPVTVVGSAADGAPASGNPVQVAGKDGSGNIQTLATDTSGKLLVEPGAPILPKTKAATSAALAAGASVDLDSDKITSGKTGKLMQMLASASVPLKVVLKTVLNAVATTVWTLFVNRSEALIWDTPHADFVQQAESATAGFDGFRVTVTNMDNLDAADVYATFLWDEV